MADTDFQKLVDDELEARMHHHQGEYSSEKRDTWKDAAEELKQEFCSENGRE